MRPVGRLAAGLGALRRGVPARRVLGLLLVLCAATTLATRQWLLRNTAHNPPSYDALVYLNQSYEDLWLLEQQGLGAYLQKQAAAGHVPPGFTALGTLALLLFGLAPVNTQLANGAALLVFSWAAYLLFRSAGAGRLGSLLGTLLTAFTPATVGFAQRHFMNDFAAGAGFLLATALLLRTGRLERGSASLGYGAALGTSLLVKSALLAYYLSHGLLLARWLLRATRAARRRRLRHAVGAAATATAIAGWFYVPNLGSVLGYYLGWAGSLSALTGEAAGIDGALDHGLFYLRNVASFHLHDASGWVWTVPAVVLLAAVSARRRLGGGWHSPRTGELLLLLVGLYAVLTLYPSKVPVADYGLVPFYLLVPVAYLAGGTRGSRPWLPERALAAAVLAVACVGVLARSADTLLASAPPEARRDWQVREVLAAILEDADQREWNEIEVGSTAVHPYYTCENLRFYVLNGAFPRWRGRFDTSRIGIAAGAEELFSFVEGADYVLTVEGDPGPAHLPNNRFAPQVDAWLAGGRGRFAPLFERRVARQTSVRVFRRLDRLTSDQLQPDGWATDGFTLRVDTTLPQVRIRIGGRALVPPQLGYPVTLSLEDPAGRRVSDPVVVQDGEPFSETFEVAMDPAWNGTVRLRLRSDKVFAPREHGLSVDGRRLLVLVDELSLDPGGSRTPS